MKTLTQYRDFIEDGLLLSPTLDTLFDAGYVSFDEDGRILTSIAITPENYGRLGIRDSMKLLRPPGGCEPHLHYHRESVFLS